MSISLEHLIWTSHLRIYSSHLTWEPLLRTYQSDVLFKHFIWASQFTSHLNASFVCLIKGFHMSVSFWGNPSHLSAMPAYYLRSCHSFADFLTSIQWMYLFLCNHVPWTFFYWNPFFTRVRSANQLLYICYQNLFSETNKNTIFFT